MVGVAVVGTRWMSTVLSKVNVFAWGSGLNGELGMGEIVNGLPLPTRLWWEQDPEEEESCRLLSAGDGFTLCASETGLYSCGTNNMGQIGRLDWDERTAGSEGVRKAANPLAYPEPTIHFDRICSGRFHSLMREENSQALYSMGASNYGQLGNMTTAPSFRATAAVVAPLFEGGTGLFACGWLQDR